MKVRNTSPPLYCDTGRNEGMYRVRATLYLTEEELAVWQNSTEMTITNTSICGQMVWPYVHRCVLKPHKTGNHKDDRGREFDDTHYLDSEKPEAPHCRRHIQFRSDCQRCVSAREVSDDASR